MTDDAIQQSRETSASVAVGSFIAAEDGERCVALFVNGTGASLSIAGARLLAKQIGEWADFAEANQPPDREVRMVFRYLAEGVKDTMRWQAVEPGSETETKAPPTDAPPPPKPKAKPAKKRTGRVAKAT